MIASVFVVNFFYQHLFFFLSEFPKPLTKQDVQAMYFNICPSQSATALTSDDDTHNGSLPKPVMIVNGLSSLGTRVAYKLHEAGWNILSVASAGDKLHSDELMWFRQDRLREIGVPVIFLDWSKSDDIELLLHYQQPCHIVYIPPGIDHNPDPHPFVRNSTMWATGLHNFVALLEAVRIESPTTRVTLASSSKSVKNELEVVLPGESRIKLFESLVGAFELTLSTYHMLYQIPFSILRLQSMYGPWMHPLATADAEKGSPSCYIDDVVEALCNMLRSKSKCLVLDIGSCQDTNEYHKFALEKLGLSEPTAFSLGKNQTNKWQKLYRSNRKGHRKVILAPYFTHDTFYRAPNRFAYLQKWLTSITGHGLEAVVLYNGLDEKFITRVKKQYPRLSFISISQPRDLNRNNTYVWFLRAVVSYLENHANIQQIIVTNISAVVHRDPFPVMEVLGDWLYVNFDLTHFYCGLSLEECQFDFERSALSDLVVVGGSRHTVLASMNKMVTCFAGETDVSVWQCVTDKQFVHHSFLFSTDIRQTSF